MERATPPSPKIKKKFFTIPGLPCKFKIMDTIGTGSCFFHSLCGAINHLGFRKKNDAEKVKIAHDLRNNFSYLLSYDDDWDNFQHQADFKTLPRKEVFDLMKDSSKWSEINIISFILHTLNYGAIFFDEQLNQMYCGARGPKYAQKIILILWEDHRHFRDIRCGDKGVFDKNERIIQHLLKKDHCPAPQ